MTFSRTLMKKRIKNADQDVKKNIIQIAWIKKNVRRIIKFCGKELDLRLYIKMK